MSDKKSVTILGSTGSIGKSTVDLVAANPDKFNVVALTANNNVELLVEQAKLLKPQKIVVADDAAYADLKEKAAQLDVEIAAGESALIEAAKMPAEWIMAAIVGLSGLKPVMAAIEQGTTVALANKESLVCAGQLMLDSAKKSGTTMLPVDSEHNAIFQVFENDNRTQIKRLILTASGGPFRTWNADEIQKATPEQAIAHPNWSMGRKISVDSASLMNKGLEVIEAHYWYDMPMNLIDVVVHPQSIIHSMVEYQDGSILAQMGAADMRTPIAHTLAWPERMETTGKTLNLFDQDTLTFEQPDLDRFPALALSWIAMEKGQGGGVVYNGANEIAVAAFLENKISFGTISKTVQNALDRVKIPDIKNLDDIFVLDDEVRRITSSMLDLNAA